MKRISTLLKISSFVFAGLFVSVTNSSAQNITENFDNISLLTGNGWFMQNNSTTIGLIGWFQGTPVIRSGPFDAFNGPDSSYIGVNYNSTTGANTISNWLVTPNRTLRNGDVITFYTSKDTPDTYPDRLEVRMSTNGASTNVGVGAAAVGDFTTLLLSINPTLVTGVYPTTWTQYTITISGLAAPTSGRFAFRYFVTNGGPSGANSDYIGIDAFNYTQYVCPGLTVTPVSVPNGTAGTAYNQSLGQTGSLGTPSFTVTAGALPGGLTLSSAGVISGTPNATGTFNFTVTVSDASGCSGSLAYSITIACPINGATLSSLPTLCSNATPYTLTQGSPAGGTYSGTGVSAGMFNPSSGTQTITYTLIDTYGCTQVANGTLTVNTAPTVTLSSFNPVCDNGGTVLLGGGSPAGGTYSGTNVIGGMFDPSGGTQNITYSYTDVNSCSGSAVQSFPVNTAPSVTLLFDTTICTTSGLFTLMGESPAGGTWSGPNVSGTTFDPAAAGVGSYTITYMYTDVNGCSASASDALLVDACLGMDNSISLNNIHVYPNPSTGTFTVSFTQPETGLLTLNIMSLDGQLISSEQHADFKGNFTQNFDMNNLSKGVYMLEVVNPQGRFFSKIVLQ